MLTAYLHRLHEPIMHENESDENLRYAVFVTQITRLSQSWEWMTSPDSLSSQEPGGNAHKSPLAPDKLINGHGPETKINLRRES